MVRRSERTRSEYLRTAAKRRKFAALTRRMGLRLRQRREELKLTQDAAAERIGIHPTTLRELEAGRANVTLVVMCALADAYGMAPHELLTPDA